VRSERKMRKIASPRDFLSEIKAIEVYAQTGTPSREKLASLLVDLADRVSVHAPYTRVALEFPTESALKKYLRDHPNADKKNHSVAKAPRKTEQSEKEGQAEAYSQVYHKVKKTHADVKKKMEQHEKTVTVKALKRWLDDDRGIGNRKKWDNEIDNQVRKISQEAYSETVKRVGKDSPKFEEELRKEINSPKYEKKFSDAPFDALKELRYREDLWLLRK
jgi:hypothetical protein